MHVYLGQSHRIVVVTDNKLMMLTCTAFDANVDVMLRLFS